MPPLPPGIRLVTTLQGPGSRAVHAAWSPDGGSLAAAFADGAIWIWPQSGGEPRRTLQAPIGAVEHLAWSPDSRRIAAGRKGPILSWEVGSGAALPPIDIGSAKVSALAWDPDGRALCAALVVNEGVERFSLRRYRCADGAEEKRIEETGWDGAWVAMSSDRRHVALSLPDGDLELWDIGRLELVQRFCAPYRKPYGVALSPDREILALSYGDGSVWMWNVPTGEQLRILQIHDAPAFSLDFSHDQSLLASKSLDGTVRFRLCDDWRKGAVLSEPVRAFESEICFHPSHLRLATYGDQYTTLRLWDLDPPSIRLFGGDDMIPVIFFSANASDVHLNVDEELREIQDHLAFARLRDQFDLTVRMAVKPDDFIRFLSGDRPRIVHFSGHGSKTGAIIAQDVNGKPFPIGAEALEALFGFASDHVECVVLNACHAAFQARAIARHIPYVVGMSTTISDNAAIAYSKGFYQALGNGVSIEKAHEAGKVQILLLGLKGKDTPVLIRREEILAEEAEAAKSATAQAGSAPEEITGAPV